MDENDSFDEEPITINEVISHGKAIGATHALLCSDTGDQYPSVVYVMPGEDAESKKERCEGGCPSVEIVEII